MTNLKQKPANTTIHIETSPSSLKYHFSGHETFPFRYAWLPKGIQKLQADPTLFGREDAIVILGVGKNMVRSIRFWCEVMGLVETIDRGSVCKTTELGDRLFGENGWDPYLEEAGTLWLLHWLLICRVDRATTWHLAFTQSSLQDFSSDDLVKWLLENVPSDKLVSENSLQRDVEVFIRTYVPKKIEKNTPLEDAFDCPLVELGLMQDSGKGVYRFIRGPKPSLPDAVFHYALVDFWNTYKKNVKTISFETLLNQAGSPGAGFKLSEDDLCERLERLPSWLGIEFNETAGMRQILLKKDLQNIDAISALKKIYDN